jgi:hypothetical protein
VYTEAGQGRKIEGLTGDYRPFLANWRFGASGFFSYFRHSKADALYTSAAGMFLLLNPNALHPYGKFLSQVMKKCLHVKQLILSMFQESN